MAKRFRNVRNFSADKFIAIVSVRHLKSPLVTHPAVSFFEQFLTKFSSVARIVGVDHKRLEFLLKHPRSHASGHPEPL